MSKIDKIITSKKTLTSVEKQMVYTLKQEIVNHTKIIKELNIKKVEINKEIKSTTDVTKITELK